MRSGRSLWLVGMMGTGKTSVGRILAERDEVLFIDTDVLIASVNDMTIPELWREKGERTFRRMETETITGASRGDEAVIATGGGAVLDPANVAAMRGSGMVVWLRGSPSTLTARIGRDPNRPLLLTDLPSEQTLAALLDERRGLYDAACHASVDTDDLTIAEVAAEVSVLWHAS